MPTRRARLPASRPAPHAPPRALVEKAGEGEERALPRFEPHEVGAAAAERARDRLRACRRRLGVAPARTARAGGEEPGRTGPLGVGDAHAARARELELAGVAYAGGYEVVAVGDARELVAQARARSRERRVEEVREEYRHPALPRCAAHRAHPHLDARRTAGRRAEGRRGRLDDAKGMCPPAPGRNARAHLLVESQERDPVADPRCGGGEERERADGSPELRARGRAEAHRRRDVEREEDRLVPLGAESLHVRLAGARRRVPVEGGDAVARSPGTRLLELEPSPPEGARVVPGEEAGRVPPPAQGEEARRARELVRPGGGGTRHEGTYGVSTAASTASRT